MNARYGEKHSVALRQLVCEFNLRPDTYMAPGWLPDHWPDRYRQQLALGPRAGRMFAHHALASNGLDKLYDFDFSAQDKRIALIAPDALRRIAEYCGLCAHKMLLAESRLRHVRDAARTQFGKDAVQFVMERTPEMAARYKALPPDPELAATKIRARGYRLLLGLLSTTGAAVYGRARLKLPREVVQRGPQMLDATKCQHLAELIVLSIIPERISEWDWLF